MAERKTKSRSRFAQGMLIYALVVAALLLSLLRPLWHILDDYEQSGPDKAMERYLETLDEGRLRTLSAPFLDNLDTRWQTREQAFGAIKALMTGELRYVQTSSDAALSRIRYNIRAGGTLVGTVEAVQGEPGRFGITRWSVESESYDFSPLLHDEEITVPETWTVFCSGTALGESERTGEAQPFALLRDFYGDERYTLPHLVSYRVEGVIGEAPFVLVDGFGQEQPRSALERSEEELLPNCSAEETGDIKTLLDGFLQRYIDCLSNASRNVQGNYNALKPYIVADSPIDKIIRDNMAGQQWAHSNGDTVTARDDLLLMSLGGGYYLAELDYTLDTVGNKGHVESVNRVLVIMQRTDAGLKVIEVYSL